MASRFEPWGVAIGEAAASGMPLICSSACGAALDLVRSFYNGLSFSPGDVIELANAMTWIEAHFDELPEMGRRSQYLAGAYAAEVWADRWHDCFRYALDNRSGQSSVHPESLPAGRFRTQTLRPIGGHDQSRE
jgi:glycosyltransferase involved in cell wall biosynthesis